MARIIGKELKSFTTKDGLHIEGATIYVTIPLTKGEGVAGDSFFMSQAKLDALDFTPAVGQEVDVFYNKFGKVAKLVLLDDATASIDLT